MMYCVKLIASRQIKHLHCYNRSDERNGYKLDFLNAELDYIRAESGAAPVQYAVSCD